MKRIFNTVGVLGLVAVSGVAMAEITIGVSASTTGPGTSLGVPVANTIAIMPKTIGAEPVRYILLDDTSDPTTGAKVVNRFATEDRVDIIIGSSTVPVAIAQGGVAGQTRIPFIALCPIPIDAAKQPFVFAVPQPISLMTDAVVEHMRANNVKSVGFIGFADAWGDLTLRSITNSGKAAGITITSNERFARNDTSVSAQMLKVIATNPDAIFVGGAGTPSRAAADRGPGARLPQAPVHTHGVVNRDFIRVGAKAAEGAIAPTARWWSPELPADHPLKAVGMDFLKAMRRLTAQGAATRSPPMLTTRWRLSPRPHRWRSRRRSPAAPNSARRCETRSRA